MAEFAGRFSLAHPDRWPDPSLFYNRLANASEGYRREIADIYFGGSFRYSYMGQQRRFGEVMGAEASSEAVRMLLAVQENFDIPVSLTLNDLKQPLELATDTELIRAFMGYISSFYAAGVRRCTISHVHLMNLGILQDAFPEMHWKNTVNHRVRTAQEVLDFAALGYQTIILDRCLNRDVQELRQVKQVAQQCRVKTGLMAAEGCMPACPFKQEHDFWQGEIECLGSNYWTGVGMNTCGRIRREKARLATQDSHALPRASTDIIWVDRDDFDTYAELVDVFKYWGRLVSVPPKEHVEQVSCWRFSPKGKKAGEISSGSPVWAESFKEIYENRLLPLNGWHFNSYIHGAHTDKNWAAMVDLSDGNPWLTDRGRALSRRLQTCRSQCYRCHACEDLYHLQPFDSIISWRKPRRVRAYNGYREPAVPVDNRCIPWQRDLPGGIGGPPTCDPGLLD